MSELERIVIEGDGEKGSSDPTIVLQEGIREITDSTIVDSHAPKSAQRAQLEAENEDWGEGFYMSPQPVLVQRGPDGGIVRTTPLSEIPGVSFEGGKLVRDNEIKEVEAKPTPVPLSRSDRQKLVAILAGRLWRYYRDRGPNDPRYNPFRDGIPDLPAGSPENLQPLPTTKLYPATEGQIMDWLKRFIGERVTVIDKKRFGGTIEDLALRIE